VAAQRAVRLRTIFDIRWRSIPGLLITSKPTVLPCWRTLLNTCPHSVSFGSLVHTTATAGRGTSCRHCWTHAGSFWAVCAIVGMSDAPTKMLMTTLPAWFFPSRRSCGRVIRLPVSHDHPQPVLPILAGFRASSSFWKSRISEPPVQTHANQSSVRDDG
jgi:hypothetical protein